MVGAVGNLSAVTRAGTPRRDRNPVASSHTTTPATTGTKDAKDEMSSLSYAVNEKVLCFHGPLLYEAKVLKAENWTTENTKNGSIGAQYFVHYKGWKQS